MHMIRSTGSIFTLMRDHLISPLRTTGVRKRSLCVIAMGRGIPGRTMVRWWRRRSGWLLEYKNDHYMLRLGILGLGEGRSTMSAALNSPKWELKKICDLSEELCRHRAEEFNFPHYTLKYQDLLDDPTLDVIGIYTPDKWHATHVKAALSHGKHVVCTKPFIDDLGEAKAILSLCESTGKKVFVG